MTRQAEAISEHIRLLLAIKALIRNPDLMELLERKEEESLKTRLDIGDSGIAYLRSLNVPIFKMAVDVADMRAKSGVIVQVHPDGTVANVRYAYKALGEQI